MYTLRKVSKSEVTTNYALGESYSTVMRPTLTSQEENKEHEFEFNRELSLYEQVNSIELTPGYNPDLIRGFVLSEKLKAFPLYADEYVYIMTSKGDTFSKLQ